jgi:hypothetical protein
MCEKKAFLIKDLQSVHAAAGKGDHVLLNYKSGRSYLLQASSENQAREIRARLSFLIQLHSKD